MHRRRIAMSVACAFGVVAVVACAPSDFEGDALAGKSDPASTSPKTDPNACTGAAALTPTDPGTLPACACAKGGKARCVPKDKVPGTLSAQLDTCTEGGAGVCVPDPLVKSGGAAPPTCKSAFGEGRCLSLCVPQVAQNASLLNRGEGDVCADDERCVPCNNPLKNGEATGVCDIGKPPSASCNSPTKPAGTPVGGTPPALSCPYTGPPVVDVKTFPACGDGARCVPTNLVPLAAAAMLKTCDQGLCAPEKSIAAGGQYLPKTCKSVANAEGRCINVNVPAVDAQKATLPLDTCDTNERCTPCFSPLDGKDTGACKTVSCDAPKPPAVKFTDCCQGKGTGGKCVPAAMVPANQQSKLDANDPSCQGGQLCAPNESLDPNFKPTTCTGEALFTGQYSGVCISDCVKISFLESLGTSQGNCKGGFTCAPCSSFGQPTGAPGCPGS
jgi:hypothetical protein